MDIVDILKDIVLFLLSVICFINSRDIEKLSRFRVSEPIEMDASEFKKWLEQRIKEDK